MTVFNKMLVAYDGSEYSKRAIKRAKTFIEEGRIKQLHIIHVPFDMYTGLYGLYGANVAQEIGDDLMKKNEEMVEEIKELMTGYEDNYHITQRAGNAAERILSYADEQSIDLIIIGSRGLGTVKGMVLGSVSQHVVRHAECNVLIVK